MEENLQDQLENLVRAIADLERSTKKALGFVTQIEYMGISFDLSRRFVIADLSPLAFFHLVEHIEEDDATAAVVRLYERLLPLLSCRHTWTPLKRSDDEQMQRLGGAKALVCRYCTGYALGTALPSVGRTPA
jgi:hypothetical protein